MSRTGLKQIIAIGGGGFSRYGGRIPPNFLMEQYLIQQARCSNPRVCFIPTASGEPPPYIVDFYQTFSQLSCRPCHLSLFSPPTADLGGFVLDQDLIYVGGGNTKSMLALWREWKLDGHLRKAWEQGTVLAGVSAGSLCWFEEGVTDSIPGPLTALKCLGFLSGSHCPHYDGEVERRPAYNRLIRAGLKSGIAADDHVGLHFVDRELHRVVRASGVGAAYHVSVHGDQVLEKRIEPIPL